MWLCMKSIHVFYIPKLSIEVGFFTIIRTYTSNLFLTLSVLIYFSPITCNILSCMICYFRIVTFICVSLFVKVICKLEVKKFLLICVCIIVSWVAQSLCMDAIPFTMEELITYLCTYQVTRIMGIEADCPYDILGVNQNRSPENIKKR